MNHLPNRPPKRRFLRLVLQSLAAISILGFYQMLSGFVPSMSTYKLSVSLTVAPMQVCVIGNSENEVNAERIYNMWQGMFPTVFYVWGSERTSRLDRVNENLAYVYHTENLSWAKGIKLALDKARSIYDCEYFFTHDDDLVYFVQDWYNPSTFMKPSLPSALIDILSRYHPAIASFPWLVGDERFPGMTELAKMYKEQEVAPLTGFDNGMVIYHQSVVDFFIPFAPRGEGGFHGEWTLVTHFLQLFGPLIFQENAMRINAIGYNNTINLDSFIAKNNGNLQVKIQDGLAHVPESRHPYEYPNNDAYIAFLLSGLKKPDSRWGRSLTAMDVTPPALNGPSSYSPKYIVNRLAEVYNLNHAALSTNQYLKGPGKEVLKKALYVPDFAFRANFFAYNRAKSFIRTWEAFVNAKKINRQVDAYVFFDHDPSMSEVDRNAQLSIVRKLKNPHGQTYIQQADTPQGLKTMIMNSWIPVKNNLFGLFIEDDIEVSPHFLIYAEKMVEAYFFRDGRDSKLYGISLYNAHYNEAIEQFYRVKNNHLPYIMQQPQSWGGIYEPKSWRKFLAYAEELGDVDPLVPLSMTNRWPYIKSWKKTYIRFMRESGGYFIYPNLPNSLSFTTNHVEFGTNVMPPDAETMKKIKDMFTLPLLNDLTALHGLEAFPTPPRDTLQIFDIFGERRTSLSELVLGEAVEAYDTCTMVMTVSNAASPFEDRLDYYAHFPILESIVIIWNDLNTPPPAKFRSHPIPIDVLVMANSSPNNKFIDTDVIKTDCVVHMPEDTDMAFDDLRWGYHIMTSNFFFHLIGFSTQAKNHVKRIIPGNAPGNEQEWLIGDIASCPDCKLFEKNAFFSMVMSSGMYYHRKYRKIYTENVPVEARELVDKIGDCEDILFNFMVARESKNAPYIIDMSRKGLWQKDNQTTHGSVHAMCLREFERIFGEMPLRYSNPVFKIPDIMENGYNAYRGSTGYRGISPELRFFQSKKQIPENWPCDLQWFKQTGQCRMVMLPKEEWPKECKLNGPNLQCHKGGKAFYDQHEDFRGLIHPFGLMLPIGPGGSSMYGLYMEPPSMSLASIPQLDDKKKSPLHL